MPRDAKRGWVSSKSRPADAAPPGRRRRVRATVVERRKERVRVPRSPARGGQRAVVGGGCRNLAHNRGSTSPGSGRPGGFIRTEAPARGQNSSTSCQPARRVVRSSAARVVGQGGEAGVKVPRRRLWDRLYCRTAELLARRRLGDAGSRSPRRPAEARRRQRSADLVRVRRADSAGGGFPASEARRRAPSPRGLSTSPPRGREVARRRRSRARQQSERGARSRGRLQTRSRASAAPAKAWVPPKSTGGEHAAAEHP